MLLHKSFPKHLDVYVSLSSHTLLLFNILFFLHSKQVYECLSYVYIYIYFPMISSEWFKWRRSWRYYFRDHALDQYLHHHSFESSHLFSSHQGPSSTIFKDIRSYSRPMESTNVKVSESQFISPGMTQRDQIKDWFCDWWMCCSCLSFHPSVVSTWEPNSNPVSKDAYWTIWWSFQSLWWVWWACCFQEIPILKSVESHFNPFHSFKSSWYMWCQSRIVSTHPWLILWVVRLKKMLMGGCSSLWSIIRWALYTSTSWKAQWSSRHQYESLYSFGFFSSQERSQWTRSRSRRSRRATRRSRSSRINWYSRLYEESHRLLSILED